MHCFKGKQHNLSDNPHIGSLFRQNRFGHSFYDFDFDNDRQNLSKKKSRKASIRATIAALLLHTLSCMLNRAKEKTKQNTTSIQPRLVLSEMTIILNELQIQVAMNLVVNQYIAVIASPNMLLQYEKHILLFQKKANE